MVICVKELFCFVKKISTQHAETTNRAPSISLIPINSFANKDADTKPTTTSKANNIFILPGSNISTL